MKKIIYAILFLAMMPLSFADVNKMKIGQLNAIRFIPKKDTIYFGKDGSYHSNFFTTTDNKSTIKLV